MKRRLEEVSIVDIANVLSVGHDVKYPISGSGIPCRNSQFILLDTAFENAANQLSGQSVYMSGLPGTGKTVLIHDWIQRKVADGHPSKSFVYVNCLEKASSVVDCIVGKLTGKEGSMEQLRQLVCSTRKSMITVVLDEVDDLLQQPDSVLYQLFACTVLPESKLFLVGIANAHDLVQRSLTHIEALRCHPIRIVFPAYSKADLVEIVTNRLDILDIDVDQVFQPQALALIAAKVANTAGDVRQCLNICRRCIQQLPQHGSQDSQTKQAPLVDVRLAGSVCSSVFGNPVVDHIKTLPLHRKLLLCACAQPTQSNLSLVKQRYAELCQQLQFPPLDDGEIVEALESLQSYGVIETSQTKSLSKSKPSSKLQSNRSTPSASRSRAFRAQQSSLQPVSLMISLEDVKFALSDSAIFANML